MYKFLYVQIRGILPQLQNNGRLKNPLDKWSKEIRRYSKKRTKIDEDHVAMMEAEFNGSLYLFDDDRGMYPYWPTDNLHAMIKTQAKDRRLGKLIDSAVVVQPPGGRLRYEGPVDRDGLWADDRFRLVKATRRGIMCCRPKFDPGWEVDFCIRYLVEKISGDDLGQIIKDAGLYLGLSNWPRRFGLFEVVKLEDKEVKITIGK